MNWRHTRDYRIWKVKVIRRDSVCVICGSRKNRQAHHKKDGSYHAKTRFDVENGVTLCGGAMSTCHTQFHCSFKNSFREKCTDKDWDNFMDLVTYVKGLK